VLKGSEFFYGFSLAFLLAKALDIVDVLEEASTFFTLCCFASLFEHVPARLLSHDDIDTLKSVVWSNVLPNVCDARCECKSCSTACLSKFVYSKVGVVCADRFESGSKVMKNLNLREVSFDRSSIRNILKLSYLSSHELYHDHVSQIVSEQSLVSLIVG
jgi:hypothetical protein